MNRLGRTEAIRQARSLARSFRSFVPELSSWDETISLGSKTQLGSSYEDPNIGARFYPKGGVPDVDSLESDLLRIISIYERCKEMPLPEQSGLEISVAPVHLALPKPFLLLAGLSGSGKTKWVRERKHAELNNFELIPVRPDWHEPSDLLGYISRISGHAVFIPTRFLDFLVVAWRDAWEAQPSLNPVRDSLPAMIPHWLCLDEMNLAPVEQYFADYLSILELREWNNSRYSCPPLLRFEKGTDEAIRIALGIEPTDPMWTAFVADHGIPLPPNLVVVGTVNMDETTHGFSRKVLDRALTIEFDEVDFGIFGGTPSGSHADAVPWTGLLAATSSDDVEIDPETRTAVLGMLERWNGILDGTPFRIAYRTINEGLLIASSLADRPLAERLDWIAMTKLLPRLEGDEDKLGMDRDGREASYLDDVVADWTNRLGPYWESSRAKRKLDFMRSRLKRSGYTSFWP
ncbi:MAG TPA: hypothetical protein DIC34_18360 [Treponema sp.]|nr:hypothetical protein [Treponema sp.]